MSNIYIQEPATRGKVVLETTVGDIEIELFSKECPLACRNFLQLCMNGYYDGTPFHRVIPEFIAQGGDPTGTGEGGESANGGFFADEFHTRLRYTRRGLVGMVNHGPNTNTSQFFFTLGSTPELDKKNTLFGKVVGNTVFNMLKLGEGEIVAEIPVREHKIIKTEIITNPFEDMVARPRAQPEAMDEDDLRAKQNQAVSAKAIKNYGLLSFGNEAEEDEEEISKISMSFKQKGTGKSAHDLTEDSSLSKKAVSLNEQEEEEEENDAEELPPSRAAKTQERSDADLDKEELERVRQRFHAKKSSVPDKKKKLDMDDDEEDDPSNASATKTGDNVKEEIERLQKELKRAKKAGKAVAEPVPEKIPEPAPPVIAPVADDSSFSMDELLAGTRRYKKKNHVSHSNSRESMTSDLLAKFRAKLTAAKSEPANEPEAEPTDGPVGDEFLKHRFASTELIDNVQDIYTNAELLTVYDPRNPMTKRRRDESSQVLHQKKHKGRS